MSNRRRFTDTFVRNVRPPTEGRKDYFDTLVPCFGLRVSHTGAKTFIAYTRWPGSDKPARRAIGDASKMSLAPARAKAKDWMDLLEQGKDPAAVEREQREQEAREKSCTFGGVAEDYISEHLANKRRRERSAAEIRRDLIPSWGARPIASIRHGDVVELVRKIKNRGRERTAHNTLTHAKSIFSWAVNQGLERYGIDQSPAVLVRPKLVIGEKRERERVLSDDELKALWRAACRMRYPIGDCVRMLMLTGCRLNETCQARWRELDLVKKVHVVPPERFKSNATHVVPLSDAAMRIVEALPCFKGERDHDYVFTTTFGKKPINGWSNAKRELERRMLRTLKALARSRGQDPESVTLEPWVFHDLRRVVRSRMAQMQIPTAVAEMVIGHGKKGIERVYDRYQYEDEVRDALQRWADVLMGIVGDGPAPANVVALRRRRRA